MKLLRGRLIDKDKLEPRVENTPSPTLLITSMYENINLKQFIDYSIISKLRI